MARITPLRAMTGVLTRYLRMLTMKRFIFDVAVLSGGTAIAQAISILLSPVITRMYGPEAFGILGVFTAIVAMLSPVSTLTYEIAIVLPPSDNEARVLASLAFRMSVAIAVLSLVVFGMLHRWIAMAMGSVEAAPYLMIVPIALVFTAATRTLEHWLLRRRNFRSISRITVTLATSIGISKVGIGAFAASTPVLLTLSAAGHLLHACLLWREAAPTLLGRQASGPPGNAAKASLRTVASAYRDFPIYRAPRMLMNSISRNTPTLILAAFFGPVHAGFYALSHRVLKLPSALISQSVGKALLPRLAERARRGGNLRIYILKITAALALVALLPFALVVAFAPQLFGVVFGAEWTDGGQYVRWLGLGAYAAFVNAPSVKAIPILGLQKSMLAYELMAVALRLGVLVIGSVVWKSAVASVAMYSVVSVLYNVGIVGWVLLRSGTHLRGGLGESGEADLSV